MGAYLYCVVLMFAYAAAIAKAESASSSRILTVGVVHVSLCDLSTSFANVYLAFITLNVRCLEIAAYFRNSLIQLLSAV